MYLSGKGNRKSTLSESEIPQFTRDVVLICHKSLGYDPKPGDLVVGKVKRW